MYDSEDLAFELLKQSDVKTFEWLFKKHYRPLCLFANWYSNQMQAAEEIVSETFALLWTEGILCLLPLPLNRICIKRYRTVASIISVIKRSKAFM